jgi:magnesium chelatase family protein
MDMQVRMARLRTAELIGASAEEPSDVVAARIQAAWERSVGRNRGVPNGALSGAQALRACGLDAASRRTVTELAAALQLTARGVHRLLRVARTVADVRGAELVRRDDVLAAAALRDRTLELAQAA